MCLVFISVLNLHVLDREVHLYHRGWRSLCVCVGGDRDTFSGE